jgi:hypothetical protein
MTHKTFQDSSVGQLSLVSMKKTGIKLAKPKMVLGHLEVTQILSKLLFFSLCPCLNLFEVAISFSPFLSIINNKYNK